jgi:hypothetical protein
VVGRSAAVAMGVTVEVAWPQDVNKSQARARVGMKVFDEAIARIIPEKEIAPTAAPFIRQGLHRETVYVSRRTKNYS